MRRNKLGEHVLPLPSSDYHWIVVNNNTLAGLFAADQRLLLVLELDPQTGEVYEGAVKETQLPVREPIDDLVWRVLALDRMEVEG